MREGSTHPVPDECLHRVLWEVEQAVENGDCPWHIEAAFGAYEAQRRLTAHDKAQPVDDAMIDAYLKAQREAVTQPNDAARAIFQEERACRAEDALKDLVNQIRKTRPVDDHGHRVTMNMAYLEACKLLDVSAAQQADPAAPQAPARRGGVIVP